MTLAQHVKLTALVSVILLPFWEGIQILWFWVGSVLIDIDHYIYFILRRKKFGVRQMFEYHDRLFANRDKIPYAGICIFHTIDFFIVIGILSFYIPNLLFLLIGLIFHLIADVFHLYKYNYLHARAFFLIEHFIRKRRHTGYPYF